MMASLSHLDNGKKTQEGRASPAPTNGKESEHRLKHVLLG